MEVQRPIHLRRALEIPSAMFPTCPNPASGCCSFVNSWPRPGDHSTWRVGWRYHKGPCESDSPNLGRADQLEVLRALVFDQPIRQGARGMDDALHLHLDPSGGGLFRSRRKRAKFDSTFFVCGLQISPISYSV